MTDIKIGPSDGLDLKGPISSFQSQLPTKGINRMSPILEQQSTTVKSTKLHNSDRITVDSIFTTYRNFEIIGEAELVDLWEPETTVAIDAEWYSLPTGDKSINTANYLTLQMTWYVGTERNNLVIWNPAYKLPKKCSNFGKTYLLPVDPNRWTVFKSGLLNRVKSLKVLMFYSPKDCQAFFGTEYWTAFLKGGEYDGWNGSVDKKRKLNGTITQGKVTIKLIDVIGTCSAGVGLEGFLESVGIDTNFKALAKGRDKGKMNEWILDNPETFMDYAIADTAKLEEALKLRTDQVNTMVEKALGFNPDFSNPADHNKVNPLPMSSGSLVSSVYELWLKNKYPKVVAAFGLATKYTTNKSQLRFKDWVKSPKADLSDLKSYPQDFNAEGVQYFHPLSASSIPYIGWAHADESSSGLFNAVVYGGRCVNENPMMHMIARVLDIDLNSCYGEALRGFTAPIGKPSVLKYPSHLTKRDNLGGFLKTRGGELVDDLYQIYVTGHLNFDCDILASKLEVDELSILRDIKKLSQKDETDIDATEGHTVDTAHVSGTMVHLKNQAKYAVITSRLLNLLKKVASKNEWNSLMDLEVTTASWYSNRNRVINPEDCEIALEQNEHAWFGVPLEGFVGNFIKARKAEKKLKQQDDDSHDLIQKGIKLFVNTTYGCLASPYFRMGNTLLANNITAMARMGAWMMAKSLGSVQSITDGGMYSWSTVRYLHPEKYKGILPSLHTMADYQRMNLHRSVRVGELETEKLVPGGWEPLKTYLHANSKNGSDDFETVVLSHINSFWGNYNLSLPFKIEHKLTNTGDKASYWGSGDYLILGTVKGETFKSRGSRDQIDGTKHVKYYWLKALVGEYPIEKLYLKDGLLSQPYSVTKSLIGVSQYQKSPEKFDMYIALPGDEQIQHSPFRPSSNHYMVGTEKEWLARKDTHNKATRKHEKELTTNPGTCFGIRKHKATSQRGTVAQTFPGLYAYVV